MDWQRKAKGDASLVGPGASHLVRMQLTFLVVIGIQGQETSEHFLLRDRARKYEPVNLTQELHVVGHGGVSWGVSLEARESRVRSTEEKNSTERYNQAEGKNGVHLSTLRGKQFCTYRLFNPTFDHRTKKTNGMSEDSV